MNPLLKYSESEFLNDMLQTVETFRNESDVINVLGTLDDLIHKKRVWPGLCSFIREWCLNWWRTQDLKRLGFTDVEYHNKPRMSPDGVDAIKDSCGWDATARHPDGWFANLQFKASFESCFRTITFESNELERPSFHYLLHYRMASDRPLTVCLVDWLAVHRTLWTLYKVGKFEKYAGLGGERKLGMLHMRHGPSGPFFFVHADELKNVFDQHVTIIDQKYVGGIENGRRTENGKTQEGSHRP